MLALSLVLSGCDMFRKLAGRPTSEELEIMRMEKIQAEEQRHRFILDSLERRQKEIRDSLAVLDSLMQLKGTILNPSEVGGLFTTKLDARYYVVVGAFKNRKNAEELLERVSTEKYNPILISFRNGFNAIAISPTNSLPEAFQMLKTVKNEAFCPDDVWILVNE